MVNNGENGLQIVGNFRKKNCKRQIKQSLELKMSESMV